MGTLEYVNIMLKMMDRVKETHVEIVTIKERNLSVHYNITEVSESVLNFRRYFKATYLYYIFKQVHMPHFTLIIL